MKILLVCGGRRFGVERHRNNGALTLKAQRERVFLHQTLDHLYVERGFTHLMHGDADGADSVAGAWARGHGVPEVRVPANWDFYGTSAGFRRNIAMAEMLTKRSKDSDFVVAFPGGRGTADMIIRARRAGLEVIEACDASQEPPDRARESHPADRSL